MSGMTASSYANIAMDTDVIPVRVVERRIGIGVPHIRIAARLRIRYRCTAAPGPLLAF